MGLNLSLFNWVFQFSHKSLLLDDLGIFFAEYLPWFMGAGALLLIISEKEWRKRLFFLNEVLLAILLGRGVVTELFRFFYTHPRPFDALGIQSLIPESGNSFPSGHATFLFALAATLFYYNRHWGGWYFLLSLLNGAARVFVGVHWPLDIAGGLVVGVLSSMLIHALLKTSFLELFPRPHEEHAG
jgi:undecaprenyl-diphosphatase